MAGDAGPDDQGVLAAPVLATPELARMDLCSAEAVHPGKARRAWHSRHTGGQDDVCRPEDDGHSLSVDCEFPVLLRPVEARALTDRASPVVQLHDLRVHLEPVRDLVFGTEHGPVVREGHVRQMIEPDWIVQTEALVADTPTVARTCVPVDDDRRHAELLEACPEHDAALAATHDHHERLLLVPELLGFLALFLQPGFATSMGTVFDAFDSSLAFLLLEPLELLERREQGPCFAAHESNMPLGASGGGLVREPPFSDPIRLHALALECPIAGRGRRHGRRERLAN